MLDPCMPSVFRSLFSIRIYVSLYILVSSQSWYRTPHSVFFFLRWWDMIEKKKTGHKRRIESMQVRIIISVIWSWSFFFIINWVFILIRSYDIQTLNSDMTFFFSRFPRFLFFIPSEWQLCAFLSFGFFIHFINYSHRIYGHCFMCLIFRRLRCLLENEQSTWIETEESDIELKTQLIFMSLFFLSHLIHLIENQWELCGFSLFSHTASSKHLIGQNTNKQKPS